MAKKKTKETASEVSSTEVISTPEPKKSYVPTSQTGLQDYSYWWEYVRQHAKAQEDQPKSFRRGRIWA